MIELLIIAAIVLTPWALIGIGLLIAKAPLGYQDEKGFHYGKPQP